MKRILFLLFMLIACISFSQADTKSVHEHTGDSLDKLPDKTKLIAYFEEELKKYPHDEGVLRFLAFGYLEENKFSLSLEYEQQALKINPDCAPCWRNLGASYANIPGSGNNEKAIEALTHSLGLDPTDSYACDIRGQLKQLMGDNFGALSDFNKAIDLNPNQADYYLHRSNLHLAQGFFSLALDDMNKVVQFARPDALSRALEFRCNLYSHRQMYQEALIDINKAIAIDSLNPGFYLDRGSLYDGMNNMTKAKEDYLKSARLNPDFYIPWYNLSRQCYRKEDMDGLCIYNRHCLLALRKSDPENPLLKDIELELGDACDSTNVNYFFHRSVAAVNLKHYKEGIELCNATLKRYPGNAISLVNRGDALFAMHDYKQALTDYRSALKANEEDMIPIFKRKADFNKFSDDSLRIIIKAMGAGYHLNVAMAEYALGMDKMVLPEMDTVMQLMISGMGMSDQVYDIRGLFLLGAGRADDAYLDFNKAISLKPNTGIYYAERALCLLCMNGDIKLSHVSVSKESNIDPLVICWSIPPNPVIRNPDFVLHSALHDCTLALEIEPASAFCWYISGEIKKLLGKDDYCKDWKKAKNLGYPVDKEIVKCCGK